MNGYKVGMKIFDKLSKPVNMFFGSDERSFMTTLGLLIVVYILGYPHIATIISVYSSVFMYSGMKDYDSSSSENSQEDDVPFDEEEMMNIMGQAGEALEEIQEEKDAEADTNA